MKKVVMLSLALFGLYGASAAEVQDLKSRADFDKTTKKGSVIVKFSTDPCKGCTILEEPYKEVSREYSDVVFAKMHQKDGRELVEEYSIKSYPTVILFKNGTEVHRSSGGSAGDEAKKWLRHLVDTHLSGSSSTSSIPAGLQPVGGVTRVKNPPQPKQKKRQVV